MKEIPTIKQESLWKYHSKNSWLGLPGQLYRDYDTNMSIQFQYNINQPEQWNCKSGFCVPDLHKYSIQKQIGLCCHSSRCRRRSATNVTGEASHFVLHYGNGEKKMANVVTCTRPALSVFCKSLQLYGQEED